MTSNSESESESDLENPPEDPFPVVETRGRKAADLGFLKEDPSTVVKIIKIFS